MLCSKSHSCHVYTCSNSTPQLLEKVDMLSSNLQCSPAIQYNVSVFPKTKYLFPHKRQLTESILHWILHWRIETLWHEEFFVFSKEESSFLGPAEQIHSSKQYIHVYILHVHVYTCTVYTCTCMFVRRGLNSWWYTGNWTVLYNGQLCMWPCVHVCVCVCVCVHQHGYM